MKLIIDIPEEMHKQIMNGYVPLGISKYLKNGTPLDGMTNGEMMNLVLRKVFPRTIFIRAINECQKTKSIVYAEEWENAPYKADMRGEADETDN